MPMYTKFTFMIEALCLVTYISTVYHIAQNFDGGNLDIFDVFELDRQNLTHQIVYKTVQHLQVYGERQ